MAVSVGDSGRPVIPGNIKLPTAYWVTADTIAWDVDTELYLPRFGEPIAVYGEPSSST